MTAQSSSPTFEGLKDQHAFSRVTSKTEQNQRYTARAAGAQSLAKRPNPPVIASRLLNGPQLSFLEFLDDDECEDYLTLLFGPDGTAANTMVREFRMAQHYHYYGHRSARPNGRAPKNPGLLDDIKSSKSPELRKFAGLAYRGDPERRDRAYWKRIAGLVWDAYRALMALRARSVGIEQKEKTRISQLDRKRAQCALRVQRYREKLKAKKIGQAAKSEAEPGN